MQQLLWRMSDQKHPDNNHGNRFESKLVFLFFIRAINKGYKKFCLATELHKFGGKFDDLIFIREDDTSGFKSYLYLQAKHGLHEKPHTNAKSITTANLLCDNKGEFSVSKYFNSYRDAIIAKEDPQRGEQPQRPQPNDQIYLTICTNIDFDEEDLKEKGIKLMAVDREQLENTLLDDMLTFRTDVKWFKFLANVLHQCAKDKDKKPLDKNGNKKFASYLPTLLKENVIYQKDQSTTEYVFHADFIDDSCETKRSKDAEELRNTLIGLKLDDNEKWENLEFRIHDISSIKKEEEIKKLKPTLYRFESIPRFDLQQVANMLRDLSNANLKKALDEDDQFKCYLADLFNENVIDKTPVTRDNTNQVYGFHANFTDDSATSTATNLSDCAKELRKALDRLLAKGTWKNWTFTIKDVAPFENVTEFDGVANKKLDNMKNSIEEFFSKLIFAVNMPNEDQLEVILKEELGIYLNLKDTDWQFSYVYTEMEKWFKKQKTTWQSRKEGMKFLDKMRRKIDSTSANGFSINYQKELKIFLKFNDGAVKEMALKLKPLLSTESSKSYVTHISTPSPKCTAVKVIAALQLKEQDKLNIFQHKDSYFVTSSSALRKGSEREWMTQAMLNEDNPQKLLVIVCEDEAVVKAVGKTPSADKRVICIFSPEGWQSMKKMNKKVIVIGKERNLVQNDKDEGAIPVEDNITFGQLSKEFTGESKRAEHQNDSSTDPSNVKTTLLDTKVSFQGEEKMIRDLISNFVKLENVFDPTSLIELLDMISEGKSIVIPSFNTSNRIEEFLQSLYVDRRIKVFDQQFRDQLAKEIECSVLEKPGDKLNRTAYQFGTEFTIDLKGNVQWIRVQDNERKNKIFNTMQSILEKNEVSLDEPFSEKEAKHKLLINEENWGRRAAIISGVAGTGKSTFLLKYYKLIKETNTNWWVIKINLPDHSESLAKFQFDKLSAIDFFANLPEVVGQSSFLRSLLKRRLETGDRIVLMLDGFDEIDGQCRKAAIQLMKSITENKSVLLYVATRPHTAEELQLELSQLAYTLNKFDEKDQIECMVKFWGDKMQKLQEEKNQLEEFAKILLTKVKTSLKGDVSDFIGIPLQCRIVAECFLPQAKRKVKQSTEDAVAGDDKKLLCQEDEEMNFDLAGLYGRLMETKRRVFLEEKLKISKPIVDKYCARKKCQHLDLAATKEEDDPFHHLIDSAFKNIQHHLLKLAIDTIFTEQEDVEILWPFLLPSFYQSDADRKEERDKLDQLTISFGLTDRNGHGKVEFLHRTYAEYLVADYIYQGFLPDENRHNELLEEEATCNFIKHLILRQGEFEGVITFLDSKFMGLVKDENWRNLIDRCSTSKVVLPNRFQKIVSPTYFAFNDLIGAAVNRKWNIFLLFWDCLDATFHKNKQQICEIVSAFLKHYPAEVVKFSFVMIERCLQYYNDPDETEKKIILNFIFRSSRTVRYNKEVKEILQVYFRFLKIHREFLKIYLQSQQDVVEIFKDHRNRELWNMAECFIANSDFTDGNDSETREICLDLLSIYESDESLLAYLVQEVNLRLHLSDWIKGDGMEKMLTALRDRGGNKTLKMISQFVFAWRPGVYEIIYQPERPTIDFVSTDIPSLMTRDSFGLTILHRATFYDETQVVERILETFRRKLNEEQVKHVFKITDDNKLTLLSVGSIRRHEKTFRLLLKFLKDVQEDQLARKLTTDSYTFIKESLIKDGMKYEIVNSLEFILKCVKKEFGQTYLVALCQSIFSDYTLGLHSLIELLVDIVFQYDISVESYTFLSEFLLISENSAFRFNYKKQIDPEIVRGMLESLGDGLFDWIRKFIDRDVKNSFCLLLRHFFPGNLKEEHRELFVKAMSIPMPSEMKGKKLSYLTKFLSGDELARQMDDFDNNLKFLKWIIDVLGEKEFKDRLLLKDENGVAVIQTALLKGKIDFAYKALAHFTDEPMKQQVRDALEKEGPRVIKERILSADRRNILDVYPNLTKDTHLLNLLLFYLKHATTPQLKTFVQDIAAIRNLKKEQQMSIFGPTQPSYDSFNRIGKFMKLLSDKLGDDAVEQMILHMSNDGKVFFARNYLWDEKQVDAIYAHLPKNKRAEIRHKLFSAVNKTGQIEELLKLERKTDQSAKWVRQYLNIDHRGVAMNILDGFNVLSLYFVEKFNDVKLLEFIELITSVKIILSSKGNRRRYSIWTDYVDKVKACAAQGYDIDGQRSCQACQKFIEFLSQKLSKDVKQKLCL